MAQWGLVGALIVVTFGVFLIYQLIDKKRTEEARERNPEPGLVEKRSEDGGAQIRR